MADTSGSAKTGTAVPESAIPERSPEHAAGEAAFMEVHETIVNIEAALVRAERAVKTLGKKDNPHRYLVEAVERAVKELDDVRRRLMQGTYWAMDERGEYYAGDAELPRLSEQQALFETGNAEDRLL